MDSVFFSSSQLASALIEEDYHTINLSSQNNFVMQCFN